MYSAFLLWKPTLAIQVFRSAVFVFMIVLTDRFFSLTRYYVVACVTSSLVYADSIRLISV